MTLSLLLLAAAGFPAAAQVVPQAVSAAVASADRPDTDRARDADRKPAEMLAFAGVQPGFRIAEIVPGSGYFTRLLSLAVGPTGKVYADSNRTEAAVDAWAASHSNTAYRNVGGGEPLAPEPVDMVWTTQNYHDFKNVKIGDSDAAAFINTAAFQALKPGGVYLVGDHDTAAGAGTTQTSTLHRIEAAVVIREVTAAGFKLDGQSDILRHPGDDHTARVFDLHDKTDQFVLRFRKPQ